MDIPMKEFELLFLLGSYPDKTLSRNRLIEEIWGNNFDGNERTLCRLSFDRAFWRAKRPSSASAERHNPT